MRMSGVGIDFDIEIEMRDRPEAGDEALSDDLAHAGEGDAGGFASGNCGRGALIFAARASPAGIAQVRRRQPPLYPFPQFGRQGRCL